MLHNTPVYWGLHWTLVMLLGGLYLEPLHLYPADAADPPNTVWVDGRTRDRQQAIWDAEAQCIPTIPCTVMVGNRGLTYPDAPPQGQLN